MPAEPLFDMSKFDPNKVLIDREGIGKINLQRYEFAQLDSIAYLDLELGEIAGIRDIREDEFWVRGHIPGRPLFPGVLMIESAAQLISYVAVSGAPDRGFMGFGGVEGVKFRGAVLPGQRIVMLGKTIEIRSRRCVGAAQGYVDGKMVFEATITGMWF